MILCSVLSFVSLILLLLLLLLLLMMMMMMMMMQAPLCFPLSSVYVEYNRLSGSICVTSHSSGHADILPSETLGLCMKPDIFMMNHFYCCWWQAYRL
jgi:hypothetical protein